MACGCKSGGALARFADAQSAALVQQGPVVPGRTIFEYIMLGVAVSVGTQLVMRLLFRDSK